MHIYFKSGGFEKFIFQVSHLQQPVSLLDLEKLKKMVNERNGRNILIIFDLKLAVLSIKDLEKLFTK